MKTQNQKVKIIQQWLVSALSYFRVLNRLTANEITEKTGINFYLLESGKRPVSLNTIVRLQMVFGETAISELLCHVLNEHGVWNEETLKERTWFEQKKWGEEKKDLKKKIRIESHEYHNHS